MINNFSDVLKKSDFFLKQAENQNSGNVGRDWEHPCLQKILVQIVLTQFHQCLWRLFDHMHPKYQPATTVQHCSHCYFFFYPQ